MDSLKTTINLQGSSGPLAARPDAARVEANDLYYATDTGQYFIDVYEDGFAPRWEQIGETSSTGVIQIFANPVTGNDANPGTSALPVRTFQRAQSIIPPSPRTLIEIILADGTYDDISPGPDEYIYTFGAMGSSNGTSDVEIDIVGTLVPFAGPYVLAAPSDVDGTTVQVTDTPGVDDWEGLSFIITDSSDPTLIGTSRMIVQNDAVGNLRWEFPYFTQIPAGSTVYVASAGSILPASTNFALVNNGVRVTFGGVKVDCANHTNIDVIESGGGLFFGGGSECNFQNHGNFLIQTGLFGGGPGNAIFLGQRIDTTGNGVYIHEFVAILPTNPRSATYIAFESSVLRNNVSPQNGSGGGVYCEFTMLHNAILEIDQGGHLGTVFCESRDMDPGAPAVLIANNCTYFDTASVFNGWFVDGIQLNNGSSGLLIDTAGAADALATGYGIRLSNAATANLTTFGGPGVSISNAGKDIILQDPAGDVIVTYVGLAVTTYAPPAAIPSLCRVAIV